MSKQKYPRTEQRAEPEAEQSRCGWVLWPAKGGGFSWCRVLLPIAVVDRHRVGPEYVPDQKGIALAKIEVDMASESVTTRRGWT